MGFLKEIFKAKNRVNNKNAFTDEQIKVEATPTQGALNLSKNDILDLTKVNPNLENVAVAAGWDTSEIGYDFDLDLCAFLKNEQGKMLEDINSTIFFGNKKGKGIFLNGDNLTGEGDGDDEVITIKLSKLPDDCKTITFAVVIYSAKTRNQYFKQIKNAYVRLLNLNENGKEICRYNLTENGEENTAIIFAELVRNTQGWSFKAIGDYLKADISSIEKSFR